MLDSYWSDTDIRAKNSLNFTGYWCPGVPPGYQRTPTACRGRDAIRARGLRTRGLKDHKRTHGRAPVHLDPRQLLKRTTPAMGRGKAVTLLRRTFRLH